MKISINIRKRFFSVFIVILFCFLVVVPVSANSYGTETFIPTNFSADQRHASIYGTTIVWDDPSRNAGDIFLYDISTGNVSHISPDPAIQWRPSIFGDLVVWHDKRVRSSGDIYLYDTSGSQLSRITGDDALDPVNIRISGDKVVWQDDRSGDWDIYLYNITEGTEYLITPDTAGSDQQFPAVSGNRIVWQDNRNSANGDVEIFMNDTATATESLITPDNGLGVGADGSTDGAWQEAPDISGNRIVWEDNRNQDPTAFPVPNIYLFESGGGEQRISDDLTSDFLPVSYGIDPVMFPSVDGNRVVWLDYRYQIPGDIFINDTGNVQPEQLQLSAGPDTKSAPKISGDRIVWTEETAGVSRIHLFTLGTPQECPSIVFSEDTTSGKIPLAVSFTDATELSRPSRWYWDFGDGAVSYDQNPVHVYTSAGQYWVNLTISDDFCRNISADHILTAGRPVADFVAAPRSGLVPLTVQFNDTSGGSPTAFDWDFENDGTVDSHVRNASFTYTVPGTYAVRFSAYNEFGTDTKVQPSYISALAGVQSTAIIPVSGIKIDGRFGGQFLTYTSALAGPPVLPSPLVLISRPPASYGWQNITFTSSDSIGFSDMGGGIFLGNVSDSSLRTIDFPAFGFSPALGDTVYFSDRMTLGRYPSSGSLGAEIWEGATAADTKTLSDLAISSSFTSVDKIGYTTHLSQNSLGTIGTSTINMSISSAWVAGTAGLTTGRTRTYILAYGTDPSTGNTIGTVLLTQYVSSDGSLDYFEADVPAQFSFFTHYYITQLSGSGNPFQLVTLSIASHINPPSEGDSQPSAESGGTVRAAVPVITATATRTPTPVPTTDPGITAKIYTNGGGEVSQATILKANDGHATVSIGEGVVAKDAGGKPLSEMTIRVLSSENVPAIPAGSAFTFAGMAYAIGPDGATFSPPVTLVLTVPQAQWGKDYSVKSWTSGSWQDQPTTFDAATGTVTVQVSHLSVFALFTEPRAPSVTPTTPPKTTTVEVTPTPQVTAKPPATAMSIFTNMIGWAVSVLMNNIVILVIVIVLAAAAVFFYRQGKFPGSGP